MTIPLFLGNPCGSAAIVQMMAAGRIGLIDTPQNTGRAGVIDALDAGAPWAGDSGCFGTGYPGDARWWAWVEGHRRYQPSCLFVTAPDVVADAAATWERSRPWLPRIREAGWPAAFIGQDGLTPDAVPWSALDVLFLGGSTEWKEGATAHAITRAAVARGVPVHMGRVNSLRRYRMAAEWGCTSVDGTFLTYGPDKNLRRLQRWHEAMAVPTLW